MADNTVFTAFHLDITGLYAEERIVHALAQDGLITFDGIQSRGELLELCSRLGTIVKHRDADEAGLTRIAKRSDMQPGEGYQAFTSSHLTLHTDGSSIAEPPTLVVLWCEQPAAEGGASLVVDGKQLYQVLASDYPQVLETLSTPNSALFAAAEPPVYGAIFSKVAEGSICVRFRYDGLGYYAAPVCSVLPTFLKLLERRTLATGQATRSSASRMACRRWAGSTLPRHASRISFSWTWAYPGWTGTRSSAYSRPGLHLRTSCW
jgi:hypothetical protein